MPDHADEPDLRAVIRGGRLTLVHWGPWLACGGPMGVLIDQRARRGVAIADLSLLFAGDVATEIAVRFLGGDTPEARAALVRWASCVGYRRLWLPGRLVDLDGTAGGAAVTTCTGCRMRWADGRPEFWLRVRRLGHFPLSCPLCGCDLPQWTAERVEQPAGDAAERSRGRRSEAGDVEVSDPHARHRPH